MGQLMAKLMSIFGERGKRHISHPSDHFDPAPTCYPPPLIPLNLWGGLGDAMGHLRLKESCVGAPCLLRSLPCPLPAHSLVGRALRCIPGRPSRRASFLGLTPPPVSYGRDFTLSSFFRPLLLTRSPELSGSFAQSFFWKCGEATVGLSSHFRCPEVAQGSRPGGKETCPVSFLWGQGAREQK